MSALTQEVRNVQNPALGSALLWRFACEYSAGHKTADDPPLPLIFVVLPILFHRETFELLRRTRRPTRLHGFADKFSRTEHTKSDVLLSIQSRAMSLRQLTWDSVRLGIGARLFTLSPTTGTLIPITTTKARGVPSAVSPLLNNAEKLGSWCSEMSLFEVGTVLRVAF